MPNVLSRWRYEAIALAVAVVCALLHVLTAKPLMGRADADKGSLSTSLVRAVQSLEGRATDLKFRVRGARDPSPDVIVLAADEKGAQRYGLWPWPRDVVAKAFDRLLDADVKAIGLDITFTDPTSAAAASSELLKRLDAVGELPPSLSQLRDELRAEASKSPDDALEAVFRKAGPRIVQGVIPYGPNALADFSKELAAQHDQLIDPHLVRRVPFRVPGAFKELNVEALDAHAYYSAQTPLRRFAEAGNRLGHFEAITDPDGSIRHSALLVKLTGPRGLLPSIALQTAAQMLDATIEPQVVDDELKAVILRRGGLPAVEVPMEGQAAFMLIDYSAEGRRFTTLSMADVIDGKFDPAQVKGKAALAGVTIVGLTGDQRVTPFSEMEPGVYTHAAVVSNILERRFLTRTFEQVMVEALLMVAAALLFGWAIPRLRSFSLKGALILVVLGGWWGGALLLFNHGLNVGLVLPSISILTSSFGAIFLGYLTVDREKGQLRSTFTRYLGEDVMEAALANPERLNRGEKRDMTVLFSDIRGFTTLSERMSPETLADFINQYLSPMTQIVFDEKGTLDKYIGDAVMAFWNAPLDQADHAVRACNAAVKMLVKLDQLKGVWREAGYPELEIGIGINTGPMIVGNMGSDVRVDYTVLGDSVNLGARLEGTNKEYDTRIIISESTWACVREAMVTRRLGAVRVKGKRQPVGIHELRAIGRPQGAEAEAITAFEKALVDWTGRRFDEAEALFRHVLTLWPDDSPTLAYLEELEGYKATPPPPDWDGVVTLKTK